MPASLMIWLMDASLKGRWENSRVAASNNFSCFSAGRLDVYKRQAFIRLYKPAYFQRVGLRYVNIFSRARLGLEGARWAELFSPAYTAPMQEAELPEDRFLNCACDLTLKLDSSCQAKVHAGPGVVKRNAPGVPQDPEVKFIFDMDLSMTCLLYTSRCV